MAAALPARGSTVAPHGPGKKSQLCCPQPDARRGVATRRVPLAGPHRERLSDPGPGGRPDPLRCRGDIQAGKDAATIADNAAKRFGNGSTRVLTGEQAQQIVDLIRADGFCESS
jgi:hypothetical protein